MSRYIRLLLVCFSLAMLLPFVSAPTPASAELDPLSPFTPLPDSCGGGLPDDIQPCCISGYVFLDGQPIAGAKVTVITPSRTFVAMTKLGPQSHFPYYHIDLSGSVPQFTEVTITAQYSSHTRTLKHEVLDGGQQVDLVLPFAEGMLEDYKFDHLYWNGGAPGVLSLPHSVAVDDAGTIYVADSQNARVQVFNERGKFLREWGTLGSTPGQFAQPFGIALDNTGDVYVADGWLHKFSITGEFLERWGDLPGDIVDIAGVAFDAANTPYVVRTGGDPGVWKLNTATRSWVKVRGGAGTGAGQFKSPYGIALDQAGSIYVADTYNHRVQQLAPDGSVLHVWGKQDAQSEPIAGGQVGEFYYPYGVAVDGGTVYVSDHSNQRIQKLDVASGTWTEITAKPDPLYSPRGLSIAGDGSIYVADFFGRRIQRILPNGSIQPATPRGAGNIPGQFYNPRGIAFDAQNNLYVADTGNAKLQRVSLEDGSVISPWGSLPPNTRFGFPEAVAIDSDGNVYATDSGGKDYNRVHKFKPDGTYIDSWNGTKNGQREQLAEPRGIVIDTSVSPNPVYVVEWGKENGAIGRLSKFTTDGDFIWSRDGTEPGGPGAFMNPTDVAIGPGGVVYLADTLKNRIVKLNSDGSYTGDILPHAGQPPLLAPGGLDVDAAGNLYVTTSGDHSVKKLSSAGEQVATFGFAGHGEGDIYVPEQVKVAADGLVYVADSGNQRIQTFRKMGPRQPPVATIVQADPIILPSGGGLVSLRGMGSSDNIADTFHFTWLLDGTPVGGDNPAPIVSVTGPGDHEIRLRVQGASGLSSWKAVRISVEAKEKADWTMLLYLDGDNAGTSALASVQEKLERVFRDAPNPHVQVVMLYDGPGSGDSSLYEQQGAHFAEVLDAALNGEVNMGNPQTLVNFVRAGIQRAPAAHYYLAIADHANGLDGIAWDSHSQQDFLTNGELLDAFRQIKVIAGKPIDVLHLDGCLMGLVENAYQVQGLADYLVSSENVAWSAFAYDSYRAAITQEITPAQLAAEVAARYHQSVVGYPHTIAALDISKVGAVKDAVNNLAIELRRYAQDPQAGSTHRAKLLELRNTAQMLDSNGDFRLEHQNDDYVDLDDWAGRLVADASLNDQQVKNAALTVRSSIQNVVITPAYNESSPVLDLRNARGLAIYYPDRPSVGTTERYTNGGLLFPHETLWDEFLASGLDPLLPGSDDSDPDPIAPAALAWRVYVPLSTR